MPMMCEKEHLRARRQIAENLQRRRRPCIVTVDKDVVKDHRARRYSFDMVLDGGQAQGKIQLIASAVTQTRNFYVFFVLSNRNQDWLVVIAKVGGQAAMIA